MREVCASMECCEGLGMCRCDAAWLHVEAELPADVRHSFWFLHVVFGMISPEAAVSILQACLRAQAGMCFGLPGASCHFSFETRPHQCTLLPLSGSSSLISLTLSLLRDEPPSVYHVALSGSSSLFSLTP